MQQRQCSVVWTAKDELPVSIETLITFKHLDTKCRFLEVTPISCNAQFDTPLITITLVWITNQ